MTSAQRCKRLLMGGHWRNAEQGLRHANAIGDGFTVGRLQPMYKLTSGRVFVNVTNNSNQWFLRIQHVDDFLVVNGRIIDVKKWHRVKNPSEIMKMVVKLILHGAKS